MSRKTKNAIGGTIRVLVLIFFFLLVVLPIYWIVITSFKTSGEILDINNLTFFPKDFTWKNYTDLFEQFNYGVLLKNSLLVSVTSALVVTVFSMLGGYSLARYKFNGKQAVILFFLITQMIPGILVIIPLYIIFSKMGLINTHIGLFIYYVTVNLPFCVITMRSFFERIPVTLEEAAKVDGCTKMQSLFKIVFPIMFPGIVSVFVFGFIGAWNELIAGSIFISTPEMWTIPVGLKTLIGKYNVEWGLLMAGGVMALLPTAVMFAAMQKFIVEGMTAGAVKE
ncbi:carbohydrate ABC transporter permease [Clostridium sp. AF19-22AC]|jgi:multiple sugar transport system permease protein|uniref:Multiple sugar transport system permease protein n=1 Tax=Faecalicatena orotica TaxID=1544 RepID=A0A2Y9BNV9_9FIRM|nr:MULTISPECIES: carbohydrate ABC transporter permease [Clostridia]PWJ21452.1 multiple sugar transport system permease protein [Faecalicatena orotica]RHR28081.1 carbohydrate ABC transporter permease [Clostridium sp. AF19-22AC]SSA58427.1 multiple sugar transport system permease protein [Faecalicatena orotica]